jgi:hypothetical protein
MKPLGQEHAADNGSLGRWLLLANNARRRRWTITCTPSFIGLSPRTFAGRGDMPLVEPQRRP